VPGWQREIQALRLTLWAGSGPSLHSAATAAALRKWALERLGHHAQPMSVSNLNWKRVNEVENGLFDPNFQKFGALQKSTFGAQ
jgi:hypothetical protein